MRLRLAEHIGLKNYSFLLLLLSGLAIFLIPACSDAPTSESSQNSTQTIEAPRSNLYALPSKDSFDLYLLIGQSNMSGRGEIIAKDLIPDPRIAMLDDNDNWVPAIDPVHTDRSVAGVGLCRSFARELTRQNGSITIGLIPCAFGGTPLERWQNGGGLYDRAVERTKNAMKDGKLKGILWHHGERDSRFEDLAMTYEDRLARMISDMRNDLGVTEVPVVVGTLGEFVLDNPKYPYAEIINKALSEIPNRVSNTACVHPIGLSHGGDHIHFSREALEALGLKYAQAITQLRQVETASATSSDP